MAPCGQYVSAKGSRKGRLLGVSGKAVGRPTVTQAGGRANTEQCSGSKKCWQICRAGNTYAGFLERNEGWIGWEACLEPLRIG